MNIFADIRNVPTTGVQIISGISQTVSGIQNLELIVPNTAHKKFS
jgi:hypothetical protein